MAQLAAYAAEHNGSCAVPSTKDKGDRWYSLGNWVSRQRAAYKKGALAAEKVARLEGMGFVWSFK